MRLPFAWCMAGRVCRVARWGAAVRRLFLREDHASSKLIRSFPAALQFVECVLGARLRSGRLVGSAVACVVSSSCSSPSKARALWWALAGGSSTRVSSAVRGMGTGAEGGGAEGSTPFGRSGLPLPQSFPPRAWCSTGVPFHRERVAQLDLGSPTSPTCAVQPVMAASSMSGVPFGVLLLQNCRASKGCLRFIIQ